MWPDRFTHVNSWQGLLLSVLAFTTLTACSGKSMQRGWIGGSFDSQIVKVSKVNLAPVKDDDDQKTGESDILKGVLIDHAYKGTPLAEAGLKDGDIVLALDGTPVKHPEDIFELVHEKEPGDDIKLQVYRSERMLDFTAKVGVERYKQTSHLGLGLPIALNRNKVGLSGLIYNQHHERHPQFASPRHQLMKHKELKGNGWQVWCLIIGFGRYKTILSQDSLMTRTQS